MSVPGIRCLGGGGPPLAGGGPSGGGPRDTPGGGGPGNLVPCGEVCVMNGGGGADWPGPRLSPLDFPGGPEIIDEKPTLSTQILSGDTRLQNSRPVLAPGPNPKSQSIKCFLNEQLTECNCTTQKKRKKAKAHDMKSINIMKHCTCKKLQSVRWDTQSASCL